MVRAKGAVLCALGLLALVGSGCSEDGDEPAPPQRIALPAAVGKHLEVVQFEAWQLNRDVVSMIQDASADFSIDLTREPAEVKVSTADSRLRGVIGNVYQLIRECHRLAEKADSLGQSSAALSLPHGLGQQRQEVIGIGTAVLLGGLAYFGYQMLTGIGEAVDRRAGPVRDYIAQASPEELGLVREVLALPAASDQQEVLDHFDDLGPGQRNVMRGMIEDQIAARQGEPNIRSLEGAQVMQSISDSSVALGQEAVKLTVGGLTTATGGQGMTQAMEAAGASSDLAAVADLALSVSGNQPLDYLTREVDVVLTSADQQELTIPAPAQSLTPAAAHQALTDTSDLSDDLDALLTLLHDVNLRSANSVEPDADGAIAVKVPRRVHFSDLNVELVDGALTMDVPQMGQAQVMVAPKDEPALITTVDTSDGAAIVYGQPAPDSGTAPRDGGVPADRGSSDYPEICRQAVACAKLALGAQEAATFEGVFGEGGQCFQSSVDADVCAQNCQDAVDSWSEDGYC